MRIKTMLQYLSTGSFTRSIHNGVLHVPQSSTYSSKAWPRLCSIHEKGTNWIHLPPTFPSHKWQCQEGSDMPSSPKHTIPYNENQITSTICQDTVWKFHHGQIPQEIHSVHYHPHLHAFSKDMKYMIARFPLLQFLDLKCYYVYLSTSLEAVNDDNDELSHQDLHIRCKHLSLHSNW